MATNPDRSFKENVSDEMIYEINYCLLLFDFKIRFIICNQFILFILHR